MDQLRGDNGQFISLEKYVMSLMDERFQGLRNEIAKDLKALDLQAIEYSRRLDDLNHAHARAQEVQHTYVTKDKYDTQLETVESARKIALERLDEKIASLSFQMNSKLDDYITKTEARQAELDQAIASQKGAAAEAQRAAEEQGRKSDSQARELARKTNRNMAILGVVVAIVIAFSQWIGIEATPPPEPTPVVTTIPAT